ncbi:MAG: AAA family ATPase, partial [Rhodopila sp.]
FMHFTSRPTYELQDGPDGKTEVKSHKLPSDPHIHIHNPWFNLVHCDDGELRAMDFAQLTHTREFGGIFQARLGDELRALGIRIRYDDAEQAVVIDAILDQLSQLFSKGRANTEVKAKTEAKALGLEWDNLPKNKKRDLLNQAAQRQLQKQDGESDQQRWIAEAREAGFAHKTCLTHEPPLNLTEEQRRDLAHAFVARNVAKEFETAAVVDLEVMRAWAARSLIGVGITSPRDVNDVIRTLMDRGIQFDGKNSHLILGRSRNKIRVTHTAQVKLEQSVLALAQRMGQDRSRSLSAEAAEAAIVRSDVAFSGAVGKQQRAAALAMMQGPALVYLEGFAGSGKTSRVLPAAVRGWRDDGRHVIGLCQAWRQADDLAEAGITERYAVTPFLNGIRNGTIEVGANTVLVLDETAQISPRQFIAFQRLWEQHGVTIRSMGDRLQCQAIEAASAAELIARPDFDGETAIPRDALPQILDTVRQSTPEQRALAARFRNDDVASAIQYKRANGTARLVGGDYDQVVARMAERYLELRDMAAEKGCSKGVAMYTLTNADAAAISQQVRARLQARGEIAKDETVYRAIDNRGAHYDLPVAVGDRYRLFKKTHGLMDGKFQSIGSNGDTVEIMGYWAQGLKLRTKTGEIADVRWSSLKDAETDRLKMGYGHCLTIDAAQGLTASVTIHALPRGTAGETAFKAYVGESRHTEFCETLISEAAMVQAVQQSRPLGDQRPLTEEHVWKRVVQDMSETPTKSLAIDLLAHTLDSREALIDDLLRLDRGLQTAPAERNYPQEIFGKIQEIEIRNAMAHALPDIERVTQVRTEIIDGMGDRMAQILRELREQYHRDDPGPALDWFRRPGLEPGF